MKFTPIAVTAAAVGILGATTCPAQTAGPRAPAALPVHHSERRPAALLLRRPADPVDASSPHQRKAVAGKAQTMKQCMDGQAAKKSGMSEAQMTRSCNDQMSMQKDSAHKSERPATAPNEADSSRTPASK